MSHITRETEDLPGMYDTDSMTKLEAGLKKLKSNFEKIESPINQMMENNPSWQEAKKHSEKIQEMLSKVEPENVDAMKSIMQKIGMRENTEPKETTKKSSKPCGFGGEYDGGAKFMHSIIQKINYFSNCDAETLLGPFGRLDQIAKQLPYLDLLFFADVFIKQLNAKDFELSNASVKPIIAAFLDTIEVSEDIIISRIKEELTFIFDGEIYPSLQPIISPTLIEFLAELKKLSYPNMTNLGETILTNLPSYETYTKYDRNQFSFRLLLTFETLTAKEKLALMKESEKKQIINKYLKDEK